MPARILKVYIEALTGFGHILSPDGLINTLLSQGCVLETGSPVGPWAEGTSQGQGKLGEGGSSQVNLQGDRVHRADYWSRPPNGSTQTFIFVIREYLANRLGQ